MSDTRDALNRLLEHMTQRDAAALLGVHRGIVGRLATGRSISRHMENRIRRTLGLPPLPEQVPVDPCPTCGEVHHMLDCRGKAVRHVRQSPASRWRDMATKDVRKALRCRVPVW